MQSRQLQRFKAAKPLSSMSPVRQDSVTIETLNLLQKTVDYLNRLPAVPTTRALCREIEAHLADPSVAGARREAVDAERLASTRVVQVWTPAGEHMVLVTVTANTVTCHFPKGKIRPGGDDLMLKALREGVTFDLQTIQS
jgi:hypothetical protein